MKSPSNFERLVLGCIDSYDSESRRIFQDFSRSTRFTFLCTAQTSKFQEKTRPKFCRNETFSFSFSFSFQQKSMNFVIFLLNFDEILSEFHEKFQEITKVLNILRNSARKIRKMLEISGICEKFSFFMSFFHSSLGGPRSAAWGGRDSGSQNLCRSRRGSTWAVRLEMQRLHGEGGLFAGCLPAKNIQQTVCKFPDFLKNLWELEITTSISSKLLKFCEILAKFLQNSSKKSGKIP